MKNDHIQDHIQIHRAKLLLLLKNNFSKFSIHVFFSFFYLHQSVEVLTVLTCYIVQRSQSCDTVRFNIYETYTIRMSFNNSIAFLMLMEFIWIVRAFFGCALGVRIAWSTCKNNPIFFHNHWKAKIFRWQRQYFLSAWSHEVQVSFLSKDVRILFVSPICYLIRLILHTCVWNSNGSIEVTFDLFVLFVIIIKSNKA